MSATVWALPGGSNALPITRNSLQHIADGQEAAVDLAVAPGLPVAALHDGQITFADWDGDCGLALDLEYEEQGHHFRWRYCHSGALLANVGSWVQAGQQVAVTGSTGLGSGPHV